jgi:hypothetical protein
MIDFTDHKSWYKLEEILNLIANKNGDFDGWASWINGDMSIGSICNICKYTYSQAVPYPVIREHGYNHLKERNLLAMI